MMTFTDKKLYLKGTCNAMLRDPCTQQIVYASNKFQTANITTSANMNEIRAGLGNAVVAMIPSDSALNVEFNAADFNLFAKAAQLGATMSYSAPVPACQIVTAESANLSIETDTGVPVAQIGYANPVCYVQTVGESGTVNETGVPYSIGTDGSISGFTATAGTAYKVFYWVQDETAQIAAINTLMDPKVLHFTAQMAVFSNENCAGTNEGTRVGWLYVVVPRLKLGANGGVVGDQSNADTTSISGQAVAYDEGVISANCSDCGSSDLAYYIYVPDNGADSIKGLAVIGGVVSMSTRESVQIPVRLVMDNGQLVVPASYSTGFTYTFTTAITGTSVSSKGVITAGTASGNGELLVSYDNGDTTLTVPVNVVVGG